MNRTIFLGPPGTGKTYTLLQRLEGALQEGIPPERIAFLTFTRRARLEAVERVERTLGITASDLPYFRTIHSMAFRALKLKDGDVMADAQLKEFGERMGCTFTRKALDEQITEGVTPQTEGDQLLGLENMARLRGVEPKALWQQRRSPYPWPQVEQFISSYRIYKQEKGLMDFTDLLEEFVRSEVTLAVDVAFIDEAQDLSALQWLVALKAVAPAQTQYIAGDDDQCQPAGTLVRVTGGESKPIEKLRTGDRVVSYNRRGSFFTGTKREGHKIKVASRLYSGYIYKHQLSTGEEMEATAEHKHIVRFNYDEDTIKSKVIYLMKKGPYYRIGQVQIIREDHAVALSFRLRAEKAEALWVLAVAKDAQEAHYLEQLYSAKYRIPQLRFMYGAGSLLGQEQLNSVHAVAGSEKGALQALEDHRLSVALPFWTPLRGHTKAGGTAIFTLEACNVVTEILCMRTELGWSKVVKKENRKAQRERVYSLEVEHHHNYISNGIVTHNCLYQWAGAEVSVFQNLPGTRQVLSQSYRLPRIVHAHALKILSRIKQRIPKDFNPREEEGHLYRHANAEALMIQPNDQWLWLVRNHYLMGRLRLQLEQQGIVYSHRGIPSVVEAEREAIYTWEKLRAGKAVTVPEARDLYAKLKTRLQIKHGHKGIPDAQEDELLTTQDLIQSHGLLIPATAPWYDVIQTIPADRRAYYRRLLRHHQSLKSAPQVLFETIHGAKGAQAPNVALFLDQSRRVVEEMEVMPDDEHRVWYVGATRAQEALHVVSSRSPHGYPFPTIP